MASLIGTAGNDSITGTADDDTITGGAGNDTLLGLVGNDLLIGDAGDDRLDGGAGADILLDSGGNNTLLGGDGDDIINTAATGYLDGGTGNDLIIGTGAGSTILGGDGDDSISVGLGATVTGGAGRDEIGLPAGFPGGAGTTIVVTDFTPGASGDRLNFAALLGSVSGYSGANPFGAAGYLQLRQAGSDTFIDWDSNGGGDSYVPLAQLLNVTASQLTADNLGFTPGQDTVAGLFLTGTLGADTLAGGGGADFIFAQAGNDSISSGSDSFGDYLYGGDGNDTLAGGPGDDYLSGDAGNDVLRDLAGSNELLGGAGNDTLTVGGTSNTLRGGDGNDRIDIGTGAGSSLVDGGAGIDTLVVHLPYRLWSGSLSGGSASSGFVSNTNVAYAAFGASGTAVHDGQTISFSGIEDIQFSDGRLVFDAGETIGQVARLYYAALGRAPDAYGLNYWTDYIAAGNPLSALAQAFVGSLEFQLRYPAVDNAGFVTLLYQNTLGRDPDQAGLDAWVAVLNGGTSRADVLRFFSESAEHYNHTADIWTHGLWEINDTGAAVARLYLAALGRSPDAAGWEFWNEQVASGAYTLHTLAAAFPASLEFQLRYPQVDNAGYVTLLYQNTLGRNPEQAGFDYWFGELNSGHIDRVTLLQAFADSVEHQLRTISLVDGGVTFF